MVVMESAATAAVMVTDALPEHTLLPFDAHTRTETVCTVVSLIATVSEVELPYVGAEPAQLQLLPPFVETNSMGDSATDGIPYRVVGSAVKRIWAFAPPPSARKSIVVQVAPKSLEWKTAPMSVDM